MILRDCDVTVDPCCDNVVDLVLKEMKVSILAFKGTPKYMPNKKFC